MPTSAMAYQLMNDYSKQQHTCLNLKVRINSHINNLSKIEIINSSHITYR
jgi:hypothetical protein